MGLYKKNQDGESLFAGKGKSVVNHNDLTGKDANNSHPISAITNLQTTLDNIQSEVNTKATQETTTNLQGQINNLTLSVEDVTNEVAEARTDTDGKLQATLNDRITHDISQIIARIDINSDLKVLGLDADFENNSFTKIGGCIDKETIFGSIGRVNLSDNGEVLARYGDPNYKEDGSNGQVMVEIPRIYYMVEPIKLGIADCVDGQSLMHGKYYISLEPRPGMKLHPAFKKTNSDKVYVSAFEGYVSDGKLNSIGDVLPTVFTARMAFEGYAKARGEGWHILDADINALVQLLVVIDIGSFDMQTHIGRGVTNGNNAGRFYTGSTVGNTTGSATSTKDTNGTEQTAADKTSVNWRGIENIYGNVWKFVIGMNVLGNGSQAGGQIYVCEDTDYDERRATGNYHPTNLYSPNSNNYIKYFGYNEGYDYLMCPTTVGGDSTKPIGDYSYSTANLNGNRIALIGGYWSNSSLAGGFCLYVYNGAGGSYGIIGARSVYFR